LISNLQYLEVYAFTNIQPEFDDKSGLVYYKAMVTYYLGLKKNILDEHCIHVLGCPNMVSIDKELLLGDFACTENIITYSKWHFPDWNIQLCSCAKDIQIAI